MKKQIFLIIFLCTYLIGFSQKKIKSSYPNYDTTSPAIVIKKEPRFIFNLHSAYSIGLGSTFKFYPDDISSIRIEQNAGNNPDKFITYSNPTKGLGDGYKFGFGVSYIVNDFINVGLDFDYFNSTIKKYRDSIYHQTNLFLSTNVNDEYMYSEKNSISYKATLLSFTPNITFKAISRPKWFVYNKLGAIITFRPNSLQEDITNIKTSLNWQGFKKDSNSTIVKKYEWGIRNPAYGFMGAFGGQFKISERARIFAEAQFSHIVFVIRKRTLTDFIVDKQHTENNYPISIRELEFVKSFSTNTANENPNLPTKTIIQRIPITYVGIQIGIAYQL